MDKAHAASKWADTAISAHRTATPTDSLPDSVASGAGHADIQFSKSEFTHLVREGIEHIAIPQRQGVFPSPAAQNAAHDSRSEVG